MGKHENCTLITKNLFAGYQQPCNGTTNTYFIGNTSPTATISISPFSSSCPSRVIIEFDGKTIDRIVQENATYVITVSRLKKVSIQCSGGVGVCRGTIIITLHDYVF